MNWKFFQRRILIVVSFLGLCSFVAGQVGQSTEPALSFDKSTLNTDQQFSASDSSVPDITGWWFALNRTSIFGDAMADGNYLLRLVIQTTNDGMRSALKQFCKSCLQMRNAILS